VLSFFDCALGDARYRDALAVLESKLDEDRCVVVERPHRALKMMTFCTRGQPSDSATTTPDRSRRRCRPVADEVAEMPGQ